MTLFAHPEDLWLLCLVPMLGLFSLLAWRKRRRGLALLGSLAALQGLVQARRGARRWRGPCFFGGMIFLTLGMAGPQWGRETNPEGAVGGRDLVVVLDLSRSMLAEQPSRQERALRGLRDLADTLQRHGGHRLALVIFAARPQVVFPLTSDYDHFRFMLGTLNADNLPAELHPAPEGGPTSGTRIGAALRLAVALHDPRFQGAQDILLLSDGDDPAGDREWETGIGPAQSLKIPIHTIGLGDPDEAGTIPFRGELLRHGKEVVRTRLDEKPLKEIAERTGGIYLPARRQALPLGKIFREAIEPHDRRQASELESTAGLPLPRQRYPWFLGWALGLLAGTLLLGDGPNKGRRGRRRWFFILPLLLVSASGVGPVADLVRRGNDAFAAGKFSEALNYYQQAEERAIDPGLVAFNKAAALYRLERYPEASAHYLRALEDQQAPPLRRARGHYDLANCLLRMAPPSPLLDEAISHYRKCLALDHDEDELRADARHNLELAIWLKARAGPRKTPNQNDQPPDQPPRTEPNFRPEVGSPKGQGEKGEQGMEKKMGQQTEGEEAKKKQAALGKLLNLLDKEKTVPLPPEDTVALLDLVAGRIANERREYRQQAVVPSESVKDW